MRPLGLLLAIAVLGGCKDRRPPPPPAAPSAPEPALALSARRPTRRYYFAHTPARCEVYWADTGTVSPPEAKPCPLDLQVGERIRMAGRTCIREGGGPERVEPVVCPNPLLDLEAHDHGEHR